MKAKLVKESLLEFHKTGDPLKSLDLGKYSDIHFAILKLVEDYFNDLKNKLNFEFPNINWNTRGDNLLLSFKKLGIIKGEEIVDDIGTFLEPRLDELIRKFGKEPDYMYDYFSDDPLSDERYPYAKRNVFIEINFHDI